MTVVYVTRRIASYLLPIVALITPDSIRSQSIPAPDSLARIVSMGFPARYHWYAGGLVGSDRRTREAEASGQALLGFYRDKVQPAAGILGFGVEGYAGRISGKGSGGMRALITVRALRLALGEDFSFSDGIHDFIIRLDDPIVRGGLFRTGAQLRFEWLPGRHNSYNFGLTVPLFQPWAGKTRPIRQTYRLPPVPAAQSAQPASTDRDDPPGSLPPAAGAAFIRARSAALRFDNFTPPLPNVSSSEEFHGTLARGKQVMETRDSEFPNGHTYGAEVAYYHRQLTLAFAGALMKPYAVADSVTARARYYSIRF